VVVAPLAALPTAAGAKAAAGREVAEVLGPWAEAAGAAAEGMAAAGAAVSPR
jgi:hypothetical protein